MSETVVAAWQDALAAEHAAVFGYSVLGPHLDVGAQVRLARSAQQAHRELRDTTVARLVGAGQKPVAPQPDYPLPFPVTAAADARKLAVRLEEGTAAAWRYLLAVAAAPHPVRGGLDAAAVRAVRLQSQTVLTAAAVRAVRWRSLVTPATPTVAFPGI